MPRLTQQQQRRSKQSSSSAPRSVSKDKPRTNDVTSKAKVLPRRRSSRNVVRKSTTTKNKSKITSMNSMKCGYNLSEIEIEQMDSSSTTSELDFDSLEPKRTIPEISGKISKKQKLDFMKNKKEMFDFMKWYERYEDKLKIISLTEEIEESESESDDDDDDGSSSDDSSLFQDNISMSSFEVPNSSSDEDEDNSDSSSSSSSSSFYWSLLDDNSKTSSDEKSSSKNDSSSSTDHRSIKEDGGKSNDKQAIRNSKTKVSEQPRARAETGQQQQQKRRARAIESLKELSIELSKLDPNVDRKIKDRLKAKINHYKRMLKETSEEREKRLARARLTLQQDYQRKRCLHADGAGGGQQDQANKQMKLHRKYQEQKKIKMMVKEIEAEELLRRKTKSKESSKKMKKKVPKQIPKDSMINDVNPAQSIPIPIPIPPTSNIVEQEQILCVSIVVLDNVFNDNGNGPQQPQQQIQLEQATIGTIDQISSSNVDSTTETLR